MPNKVYGIKRIAAGYVSKDPEAFWREVHRFEYLFSLEHRFLRIREEKFFTFVPEGISCYLDGQYHYTPRYATKPKDLQFHNLIKDGAETKD